LTHQVTLHRVRRGTRGVYYNLAHLGARKAAGASAAAAIVTPSIGHHAPSKAGIIRGENTRVNDQIRRHQPAEIWPFGVTGST